MGFPNLEAVARAVENGQTWYSPVFKTSTPFISSNIWYDSGPGTGMPVYQAYLGDPLVAQAVTGGNNKSIFLGPSLSANQQRYLLNWSVHCTSGVAAPCHFLLVDVLLYYPLIDGTDLNVQTFDNTVTLPRYDSGEGVYATFVTQTPGTNTQINADGVYALAGGGTRSIKIPLVGGSAIGRIMTLSETTSGATAPFMRMGDGDRGIRYFESITFNASAGGFVTLVLFKPIAQLSFIEAQIWHEKNYFRETGALPQIHKDAALNLFFFQGAAGGALGNVSSLLQTVWD